MENLDAVMATSAGLIARPETAEVGHIVGVYTAECYDADGNLKWRDEFPNRVVNVGKNWMLDQALSATASNPGTIYMGLVDGATTPTYDPADTMASHTGWSFLNVTANRGTVSFSAAATGSKAASAVPHAITSSGTAAGCYLVIGGTNGNTNTTGTLFSAGSFTGGNRTVASGDTLNVTYSVSV